MAAHSVVELCCSSLVAKVSEKRNDETKVHASQTVKINIWAHIRMQNMFCIPL